MQYWQLQYHASMYWRLKYVCVFVGEHFWCFLSDTCSHHSPFVIYLSSLRQVTPVILRKTCDQLYFTAKVRDFWQSSLKKWETCMDIGAGLESAVWFLSCNSCHGSLASCSLAYFFILLFHLGNLCFITLVKAKISGGCAEWLQLFGKKNQNEIYLLFSASKNTRISTD